ncbi:hypothetical protein JXA85_01550 [Candidatus Woesearchaeota archaeon]|nr:hypothetical protein [Candidatus Woesearchaeota archaeon]
MSMIKGDDSVNGASVIEELKKFEESKESKLIKLQRDSELRIENARKRFDKKIGEQDLFFEKKKAMMIKRVKEDVRKEGMLLAKGQKKSGKRVEELFSQNFNAAKEAVLGELLK